MLKGSKTQITLSVSARGYSGGGASKHSSAGKAESHELKGIGAGKAKVPVSSSATIVDDMVYRRAARIIAAADISYSAFMIGLQMVGLIVGTSRSSSPTDGADEDPASMYSRSYSKPPAGFSQKFYETIAVLVWTALFTLCILQLVVAGALYGGTNERDGRKCIRNCRIWCMTTVFLALVLVCQVMGVLFILGVRSHVWLLILLVSELSFRLTALVYIRRFIAELVLEFCDDDNMDRSDGGIQYEPLLPSPMPILKHPPHCPV